MNLVYIYIYFPTLIWLLTVHSPKSQFASWKPLLVPLGNTFHLNSSSFIPFNVSPLDLQTSSWQTSEESVMLS